MAGGGRQSTVWPDSADMSKVGRIGPSHIRYSMILPLELTKISRESPKRWRNVRLRENLKQVALMKWRIDGSFSVFRPYISKQVNTSCTLFENAGRRLIQCRSILNSQPRTCYGSGHEYRFPPNKTIPVMEVVFASLNWEASHMVYP